MTCARCDVRLPVEEVFIISHSEDIRWNLQHLCEPCADEVIDIETRNK